MSATLNIKAEWREEEHPRDEEGKFSSAASSMPEAIFKDAVLFLASEESKRDLEKGWLLMSDGSEHSTVVGTEEGTLKLPFEGVAGGVMVHTHPQNASFSHRDVMTLAKAARGGHVAESVVVAKGISRNLDGTPDGLDGHYVYVMKVTQPWSSYDWNSTIMPALDKKAKALAREWNKKWGDTLISGGPILHDLWKWAASSKGSLSGRMTYERLFRPERKEQKSFQEEQHPR